jgi:hypothetical protein
MADRSTPRLSAITATTACFRERTILKRDANCPELLWICDSRMDPLAKSDNRLSSSESRCGSPGPARLAGPKLGRMACALHPCHGTIFFWIPASEIIAAEFADTTTDNDATHLRPLTIIASAPDPSASGISVNKFLPLSFPSQLSRPPRRAGRTTDFCFALSTTP